MCAKCQEAPDPWYLSGEACKECPFIPTAAIGMGVLFILSAIWFVRTDLSQWQQMTAIKQMLCFGQNLDIVNKIDIKFPATWYAILESFKLLNFNLENTVRSIIQFQFCRAYF